MEQEIEAEVLRVREAYRRGVAPSQVVEALMRRGWGTINLIILGQAAFDLTIGECKSAKGWSPHEIDAAVFDAYFVPLIERNRTGWDR